MPEPTDPVTPPHDDDDPLPGEGAPAQDADEVHADEDSAGRAAGGEGHPTSEFERGVESFARVVEGVAGKVLGPKALGRKGPPPGPVISEEADRALEQATEAMGRYLHAAGEGLKAHPFAPGEAVRTAQEKVTEEPPTPEGWSPLVGGMRSLSGGLFRVAEGVLDQVAPRKKRPDDAKGE